MYPWLAHSIDAGTTVVTASRRLALELRRAYDESQQQAGLRTWRTPEIHYWSDWLNRLIDDASPTCDWPTRIDTHSSAILWERCLAKHGSDTVLSFAAVVRQARQSWQRLRDWLVPLDAVSKSSGNPDQKIFAKSAWAYQETLRGNNWIDAAQLPELIADCLNSGDVAAPGRIILAGFDRITPATQRVIDALRSRDCSVDLQMVAPRTETVSCQSFLDRQQELRAAGYWARQFLMHEPTASVAIVCPDLEANAESTSRLVREGLAPGWQYAGDTSRNVVDVSYGRRLGDFPAIAIALLALRWVTESLDSREIGILLRSSSIVSSQLSGRSQLELELRRWPDRQWTAASLAAILRARAKGDDAEEWLRFLDKVTALRAGQRGSADPSHWAEVFDRFLAESAWPGEGGLDSAGYQLLERWRSLLLEFSATGRVTQRVSINAAVERVRSMASELIFQPRSSSGIVHLIGMLETSGIAYDGIWVCGLDATRWPAAANPLYLVSRQLQEDRGMPDASPRDNLEFAETVLQRVVDSARTVVASWSTTDGEAEIAASPLLEKFQLGPESELSDPGWHATTLQDTNSIITLEADDAPALVDEELVSGGAATVQLQNFDPFAAFARGRLGIRDIQRIEAGLPAALKGNVAHKVLHALFSIRPDSVAIAGWTEAEVSARIDQASSSVFAAASMQLSPLHRKLLDLERKRLAAILASFIDAERSRPQFTVESVEEQFEFKRHGVNLKLRVDRIDRLADSRLLILDYKTGQAKSLLNRDGELTDLQLVVYAAAVIAENRGQVGGLALVNVDSRAISYKGTGGSVTWDAKRSDDWDHRLSRWLDLVDAAMLQLASGDVRVNLSQPVAQARPLALLSRIAEFAHEF